MKRKIVCMALAASLMVTTAFSSFALTEEINNQISGNSLLVGDHLFELDKNNQAFNLNSFMTSVRSIEEANENAAYYKDANGHWYDIVADQAMK